MRLYLINLSIVIYVPPTINTYVNKPTEVIFILQKTLFTDNPQELCDPVLNKNPIYPLAPDFYHMCPRHNTCPGFISILAHRGSNIIYYHYLQCPDLIACLPPEYLKMVSESSGTAPKPSSKSSELLPTDDEYDIDF